MSALAFSVHIFTAIGAALALLALDAAVSQEWAFMFFLLGLALIVDAVDGPIARALNVAERLPRWSGDVLDLVVDFLTYVVVPAYAIMVAGMMPVIWANATGMVIVVTGAIYFADRRMKLPDNCFRGFPALWNVVVFYLLLLRPSAGAIALIVAIFAVLQFVPMPFVHPVRVRVLRPVTLTILGVWAVLAANAVYYDLHPRFWVTAALCAAAVYFVAVGFIAQRFENR